MRAAGVLPGAPAAGVRAVTGASHPRAMAVVTLAARREALWAIVNSEMIAPMATKGGNVAPIVYSVEIGSPTPKKCSRICATSRVSPSGGAGG